MRRSLHRALALANRVLRPYEETVWIVGDGRSGTNWLSTIVNHDHGHRFLYEPFHPTRVAAMRDLRMFEYARPGDQSPVLQAAASPVFDGTITDPRVTRPNRSRLYSRLLVKDIFAHLLARWVADHRPQVKIVLLMRHPFAVAVSKQKKRTWQWMTEPARFLQQPDLMTDHLEPYRDALQSAGTYFEKQVTIWCAIHAVWFRQFEPGRAHTVVYEELCRSPESEAARLGEFLRYDGARRRVMGRVATETRRPPPDFRAPAPWATELGRGEIDAGLRILATFGWDSVYGGGWMPNARPEER